MQTSTAQFGELSLKLPSDVREVYLLTAAAAPATEPWGIDWMQPAPARSARRAGEGALRDPLRDRTARSRAAAGCRDRDSGGCAGA